MNGEKARPQAANVEKYFSFISNSSSSKRRTEPPAGSLVCLTQLPPRKRLLSPLSFSGNSPQACDIPCIGRAFVDLTQHLDGDLQARLPSRNSTRGWRLRTQPDKMGQLQLGEAQLLWEDGSRISAPSSIGVPERTD